MIVDICCYFYLEIRNCIFFAKYFFEIGSSIRSSRKHKNKIEKKFSKLRQTERKEQTFLQKKQRRFAVIYAFRQKVQEPNLFGRFPSLYLKCFCCLEFNFDIRRRIKSNYQVRQSYQFRTFLASFYLKNYERKPFNVKSQFTIAT